MLIILDPNLTPFKEYYQKVNKMKPQERQTASHHSLTKQEEIKALVEVVFINKQTLWTIHAAAKQLN
jgi:hypothetical protein